MLGGVELRNARIMVKNNVEVAVPARARSLRRCRRGLRINYKSKKDTGEMFENDDRAPALKGGLGEGPWPSIDFRRT